ncbi:MAG: aldehyde dehydrogenase family protein [Planctomycetota bacterium]
MLQAMHHATSQSEHEADGNDSVADAVSTARQAQSAWRETSVRERLAFVQAVRRALVASPRVWAEEITHAGVRSIADSLAAEVLPTADACRFLERNAVKILRERSAPRRDRPIWGRSLTVRVRREPIGVVLVIGAGNYPLFLAGVQTLQALTAGNAVLIKPSPGGSAPMRRLVQTLEQAGLPAGLVQVLDESPATAERAIELGVGRVVLTGSAATGRKVMAKAAETLTPCTMELSGCDAVFVLPGADLDRVAAALTFGLRLNGGATCIGPRRVFVTNGQADALIQRLRASLPTIQPTIVPASVAHHTEQLIGEALDAGAKPIGGLSTAIDANAFSPVVLEVPDVELRLLKADLFAPVMSVVLMANADEALRLSRQCPYALGAGVFGPAGEAEAFADRVEAGCVTVNDLVAPTADPRVPFGGWNQSGYGVTRGAEGLLEMTRPKAVVSQRAGWLPHLDPPRNGLDRLIVGLLRMAHGSGLAERWRGLRDVVAGARSKSTNMKYAKDSKE